MLLVWKDSTIRCVNLILILLSPIVFFLNHFKRHHNICLEQLHLLLYSICPAFRDETLTICLRGVMLCANIFYEQHTKLGTYGEMRWSLAQKFRNHHHGGGKWWPSDGSLYGLPSQSCQMHWSSWFGVVAQKCANHHANVVWQESIVPLSVHAEVNATGTTPQLDFTLWP